MISPCNSLNVKTIKYSQLAAATSVDASDLLYISQYDSINSVFFSRKITFSNLVSSLAAVPTTYKGIFSGSLYVQSAITSSMTTLPTAGVLTAYLPIKVDGTNYKLPLYAVS